jgi:hypothetical protein
MKPNVASTRDSDSRLSLTEALAAVDANAGVAFGAVAQSLQRVFALADVADEELRRVFPDRGSEPANFFLLLEPPIWLPNEAERWYRAYVRELVQRAKSGASLAEPTAAEALYVLHRASLDAPRSADFNLAFARLYRVCGFPDAGVYEGQASYPDAVEEILHEAYRAARRLVSQARLEASAAR